MRSLQCERGTFVVVQQRRFPSRSVVTTAAIRASRLGKLQAVNIGVAGFAFRRRRFEIDVDEFTLGVDGLMAAGALRRFVDTDQRKRSFRMIVAGEFFPVLGGVANLTDERGPVRRRPLHESIKSAFMRIFMATLTSQALPVILRRWLRSEISGRFVTVAAWNRHVTSAQAIGNFVVSTQAECRWEKPLQVVAIFASVEVWGGGKLPSMFVGVTICAVAKLHGIDRSFPLRNMALCARQCRMLALQWIGGRRVLFQSEGRGLKAIDRVAI